MFFASAPPLRRTFLALLRSRSLEIWKIHTSVAPPAMVTSVGMVTPVPQVYRPGASVRPPRLPLPRSRWSGLDRPAASVYAACMLSTAWVRFDEVGDA